jgi:hypothetical protein
MKADIISERVSNMQCPVCAKILNAEKEEIIWEDYNGVKQPVHKRHKIASSINNP